MNEFIDQKKEMFHAELAYKTVQQEITQLTEKQNSRTTVLNESKIELE
jgi:hypothetical protein